MPHKYRVTYQGGHPDFPKRLRSVGLALTDDALVVDTYLRGNVIFALPFDALFGVWFPMASKSEVNWDPVSRRLIVACNSAVALGARLNGTDHIVVLDAHSDVPQLYNALHYAVGQSPLAGAGMPRVNTPDSMMLTSKYVGGHPRFPQPQDNALVSVSSWGLNLWHQDRLRFGIPFEDIHSVHTQFSQTSGRFLGFGLEGMLEASVAAFLTRRNHHVVLVSTRIDQKLCGLAFNCYFEEDQQRLYDILQSRLDQHSHQEAETALPQGLATQLQAIAALHREGLLNASEFQQAKQRIIAGVSTDSH